MTRKERRALRRMARDWQRICRRAEEHAKRIGGTPCVFCKDYEKSYAKTDRPATATTSVRRYGDPRQGWITVQCCKVCARDATDPQSKIYRELTSYAEPNPNSSYVLAHPLKEPDYDGSFYVLDGSSSLDI